MLSPPKSSKVVSDQATQQAERLMDSLPSELLSFIQHLRPLFRAEVFNSFVSCSQAYSSVKPNTAQSALVSLLQPAINRNA